MTHPRAWAVGTSRDDRIDGSPERGHVAKYRPSGISFRCVSPHCTSLVDSCGLYCALHLWTLDNPVLRDARVFQ